MWINTNYFVYSDINNKGNIMTTEQIIELLESIDQNINYGNLDEAQVDIAINLRTLYKQLVKKFHPDVKNNIKNNAIIGIYNSFRGWLLS